MSKEDLAFYKQDFVKPFDLGTGPLYRFEIVTTEKQTYLLMDIHHLVFDDGSVDIFLQRLCSLLNGSPVEEEEQSYATYVTAEKVAEGSEDYLAATDFFKDRLAAVEAATEDGPTCRIPSRVLSARPSLRWISTPSTLNTQRSIVNSHHPCPSDSLGHLLFIVPLCQ